MPFYTKNAPFCQDRLGTNIGKSTQKETRVFLQELLPPIVDRLRKICRVKLDGHFGPGYCDGLNDTAGMFAQVTKKTPCLRRHAI
jgi:hypothetical protein